MVKRLAIATSLVWLGVGIVSAQGLKIGVMDVKGVFEQHPKTQFAKETLKKELEERRSKIDARTKEIVKLEEKLSLLSGNEREKQKTLINQKKEDLKKYSQEAENYLTRHEEELTKEITEEIWKVIETIAKENKIDLVLEKNIILYGIEDLDLSSEVIKRKKPKGEIVSAQGLKIGVVNMPDVFNHHPVRKTLEEKLKEEMKDRQKEIDAQSEEIAKLEEKLGLLSGNEHEKQRTLINQKKEDLKKYSQEAENYLIRCKEEFENETEEEICKVIVTIAKENKIDLVIPRVLDEEVILYKVEGLDLNSLYLSSENLSSEVIKGIKKIKQAEDYPIQVTTPKTFVVANDGSGDFKTVQAALLRSSPGDTILLRQGSYSGFEIPFSNRTIRGEGEKTVVEYIVIKRVSDVKVENLSIIRESKEYTNLVINEATNIFLSDLQVKGGKIAIKLSDSNNIFIEHCKVSGAQDGIAGFNARFKVSNSLLFKNECQGVCVQNGCISTIESNTIVDNGSAEKGYGLVIVDSQIEAYNNLFSNNKVYNIGVEGKYEYMGGYNNFFEGKLSEGIKKSTDSEEDSLFVNRLNGDYRLRADSPLANKGRGGSYIGAFPPVGLEPGKSEFK